MISVRPYNRDVMRNQRSVHYANVQWESDRGALGQDIGAKCCLVPWLPVVVEICKLNDRCISFASTTQLNSLSRYVSLEPFSKSKTLFTTIKMSICPTEICNIHQWHA